MIKWQKLNKTDVNMYKGLAILMIVLHNFMHLFPYPKEMEFAFYDDRFFIFVDSLLQQPENIVRFIFSFFGHFGVQIFVFVSAYGLTKRYINNKPEYLTYMWRRFINIYPSFLLAMLIWAILTVRLKYGLLGPLKYLYWNIDSLILKITLLSNFIHGERFSLVGPWWFVSFIFQFYFIFPLLLKFYTRWSNKGLAVISVISILLTIMVHGEIAGIKLYFTIVGHLPEFCLGLYLAKNDETGLEVPALVIFIALMAYILGNIYEVFWYVNHISFLILLLAVFNFIIPKINEGDRVKNIIMFFGAISMPLFLVNGFLRKPFITWAKDYDHWLLTIALCIVSLSTSIIVALILQKGERYLMLLISRFLALNRKNN